MEDDFVSDIVKELKTIKEEYEKWEKEFSEQLGNGDSWYDKDGYDKWLRSNGTLTKQDTLDSKINDIDSFILAIYSMAEKISIRIGSHKYTYDENLMGYVLSNLDKSEQKMLRNALSFDKDVREESITSTIKDSEEDLISKMLGGRKNVESYHTREKAKQIKKENEETQRLNYLYYAKVIEKIRSGFRSHYESVFLYNSYYLKNGKTFKNDYILDKQIAHEKYFGEHTANYYPKDVVKKCQYLLSNDNVDKLLKFKIEKYRDISIELEKTKYIMKLIVSELHISTNFVKTREACKKIVTILTRKKEKLERKLSGLNINLDELYTQYKKKDAEKTIFSKFRTTSSKDETKEYRNTEEVEREDKIMLHNADVQSKEIQSKAEEEYYRRYRKRPDVFDRDTLKYKQIEREVSSNLESQLKSLHTEFKNYLLKKLEFKAKEKIMALTGETELTDEKFQALIQRATLSSEERYIIDMVQAGKMKEGTKPTDLKAKDFIKIKKYSARYYDNKCDEIIKEYVDAVDEIKKTNYFTIYTIEELRIMVNKIEMGKDDEMAFRTEQERRVCGVRSEIYK